MRVKAESMEEGPFPSYIPGGMGVLERRTTMASDTSEALGEIGSASEQLLCNGRVGNFQFLQFRRKRRELQLCLFLLESCAPFVLHRSMNPRQAAGQIAKVQLGKTWQNYLKLLVMSLP